MNKKSELVKNTFIILMGKVCTQFLSYFLLPLYTSCLNSEEYGIVDLITTYVTLLVPIITLQLEMGIFRELIDARNDELKQKFIITSGFFSIIYQFSFCLIIYLLLVNIIEIPFSIYILFCIICTMFSNLFLQISRGFGDNIGYSIASMIAGVSTIFFNIVFILGLNLKIEGMLLSTTLGNLMAIVYLFFKNRLYMYINFHDYSKKINIKLLRYSIPLVPNGLIWWIINVSDRTLITFFIGAAANGVYAISNKFSNILIQIYNVFNLSWTESASLHINEKDKDSFFTDTFNDVFKIFGSICILLLSVMPFLFEILIDLSYREAYYYIPILLLGTLSNIIVSFIGSIYVGKKMTKQVATTSLWAGILNILINIVLIKQIGVYAAAISTVLAFTIMSLYRIIDVQKYVKLKLESKNLIFIIILYSFTCCFYYLANKNLCIIWLILMIVLMLGFNYKFVKFFLRKLKIIK